ncbi:alternate-type signal peptide domain-containing protein [Microbacterium sp.]|uniref:alternate-type signal peptide domain-containing protein n=1 Tax=Microbacterium sp. TaxID=51671 RepID=UPI00261359F3|nr:alternate-type signal peptide domain-containing protein [Microbacterium sp.]
MSEATSTTRRDLRRGSRTKAIVAIAAGAVLLLGGGTTLAYWSTQATIDGGTISSGDLNLTLVDSPSWSLTPEGGTSAPVPDIAAIDIVPGDTVTLTQDVTLTLVGDNLIADLPVGGVTVPTGIVPTAVTLTDGTGATFSGTGLTSDLNGETVTASVAFQFDPATADRDLVTTDFVFDDVQLTLEQQDPTP